MTLQNGMLNDVKHLILITGTSTAGKSTLAKALLSGVISNKVKAIPQATTREPREDDDSAFLLQMNEKEFYFQNFFSCHGIYGILQTSYDDFINSDSPIGLSIVSDLDIIDFSKKATNVKLCRILVTLTNSLEDEIKSIKIRIPHYFPKEKQQKRIEMMCGLARRSYFNPHYRQTYIDLHLSQECGDFCSWIEQIIKFNNLQGTPKRQEISKFILSSNRKTYLPAPLPAKLQQSFDILPQAEIHTPSLECFPLFKSALNTPRIQKQFQHMLQRMKQNSR